MASSRDTLQAIRNRIGTAHVGWQAFGEACVAPYDAALSLHKKALQDAEKLTTAVKANQLWEVFGFMMEAFVGPWAKKLLTPVAGKVKTFIQGQTYIIDDLSAAWTSEALSGLHEPAGDALKSIKGTALEKLKGENKTMKDAFATSAEETVVATSRLKEGIHIRGKLLMAMMDELVERADSIPESFAKALFTGFTTNCSFLTDVPDDTGEGFKKDFQKQAELAMWVSWAVARDEAYWRRVQGWESVKDKFRHERKAMNPIWRRLIDLGVPDHEISEHDRGGGYEMWMYDGIDMVKLIAWAKKMSQPKNLYSSPAKNVCYRVDPGWLQLRRDPNKCYVQ
ncbi:hypothetical protein Pan44_38550 [Caulifigura coniformis]|uniref:Uncharacterized protein n=1 Tax=Caulifigura coniformis TaxID=2527983 RepID=A0A517SI63_9PLAN|nr:hypothetical protein [Caulifigura coniformis]QDT55807.1 hypothetical protein Pan44_38550 [Caulifigura coniformis]